MSDVVRGIEFVAQAHKARVASAMTTAKIGKEAQEEACQACTDQSRQNLGRWTVTVSSTTTFPTLTRYEEMFASETREERAVAPKQRKRVGKSPQQCCRGIQCEATRANGKHHDDARSP